MAGPQLITNPNSAYRTVSDFRTLKTDEGERILRYGAIECRAGGAVAVGDVVCWLSPASATAHPSVVRKVTARKFASTVGVVDKILGPGAGVAGDTIAVVTDGLAFVNVGSGTPAAGDNATVQGNSHEAGVVATEADATTITGTILGTFLGAKDAANRAPVYVNHH